MAEKTQYVTIHPGEVLRIELDSKGISQKEFAATLAMPAPVLNDILKGKRNITPDIAVLLESILSHDASYWLRLQAERDIEVAKKKEEFVLKQRYIETWKSIQDCCNTKFLEKHINGGLGKTIREKIQSVLDFFNVNSLQELKIKFVSDVDPAFFRKSLKLENNPVNIFTWKAIAYMKSDMERCSKTFNPDTLDDICEKLSKVFLENTKTLTKIQEILGAYGIKFLIMDNEKGTHIDGFSFIRNCTPTIVLTLRNKKIDILAFTLLHELYHIYTHLDSTDESVHQITLADYKESIEELEADAFAKNTLIKPRDWQMFKTKVKGMSPYAVASHIRTFALENGIHPAIVLGRYQHDFNVYDNGRGFDRSIN